jgi:hypothetical protein
MGTRVPGITYIKKSRLLNVEVMHTLSTLISCALIFSFIAWTGSTVSGVTCATEGVIINQ